MKFFYLLGIVIIVFVLAGCRENIVEFQTPVKNSNIYVNSNPLGADIYFNDVRTGKITPDSLVNVQPGSYVIRVSLLGVGEETTYIDVVSGQKKYVNIVFR